VSFEQIAGGAGGKGERPVTAIEMEASYRKLVERITAIEASAETLRGAFWLRRRLIPEPVVARIASTLSIFYHPMVAAGVLAFIVFGAALVRGEAFSGRVLRHGLSRVRGRPSEPLPWSTRVTAALVAYTLASTGFWVWFMVRAAPLLFPHVVRAVDVLGAFVQRMITVPGFPEGRSIGERRSLRKEALPRAQQDRIDDQQDFIRKPMFEQRRCQRGATREDRSGPSCDLMRRMPSTMSGPRPSNGPHSRLSGRG
jgi:hypothetical protein